MPNDNRNKMNQPPTGVGKKQSPEPGEPNKLNKRAEVLQSSNAEQNIGTAEEEEAARTGVTNEDKGERKMRAGR
ncbi:MAG TPA: hypothetical protein VJV03_03725 [Pyrinomonadaceae bacterium]|nr:hypothetical protein [Pyrinomonadaceae bacterium]